MFNKNMILSSIFTKVFYNGNNFRNYTGFGICVVIRINIDIGEFIGVFSFWQLLVNVC